MTDNRRECCRSWDRAIDAAVRAGVCIVDRDRIEALRGRCDHVGACSCAELRAGGYCAVHGYKQRAR